MFNFDPKQQIRRLNAEFREKTKQLGNNNLKGTKLYDLQVDFAYLIDEIERGPIFAIPHIIYKTETLIRSIGK